MIDRTGRDIPARMHYYQHNISDYSSHTGHLEPLEDLAYRRMLDYCYLHEIGLPESPEEIGRLIRMRTHCDCIANALQEFFYLKNGSWFNKRVEKELESFRNKKEKASKSAKARWAKNGTSSDANACANAMQDECERNANHKPITNNHKPSRGAFAPPTLEDVSAYCSERGNGVDPDRFINFYESKGWMVGRNRMKDWKAAVRTWEQKATPNQQSDYMPTL